MHPDLAMMKQLAIEQATQYNTQDTETILKIVAQERDHKRESAMIAQALQQAITETVQRIASVIINERRAEIEAACNFGELRDVLAAELARQFMSMRLMGQPVPGDAVPGRYAGGRMPSGGGVGQGPMATKNTIPQMTLAQALKGTTP